MKLTCRTALAAVAVSLLLASCNEPQSSGTTQESEPAVNEPNAAPSRPAVAAPKKSEGSNSTDPTVTVKEGDSPELPPTTESQAEADGPSPTPPGPQLKVTLHDKRFQISNSSIHLKNYTDKNDYTYVASGTGIIVAFEVKIPRDVTQPSFDLYSASQADLNVIVSGGDYISYTILPPAGAPPSNPNMINKGKSVLWEREKDDDGGWKSSCMIMAVVSNTTESISVSYEGTKVCTAAITRADKN